MRRNVTAAMTRSSSELCDRQRSLRDLDPPTAKKKSEKCDDSRVLSRLIDDDIKNPRAVRPLTTQSKTTGTSASRLR
jgi:hypothetical protein